MNKLDVRIFNKQCASVRVEEMKDINEIELDYIFQFLFTHVNTVYFFGRKLNFNNDEFEQTVVDLCNEVLWADGDPPRALLFRIKSEVLSNRALLVKMWNYYEFPGLIFCYNEIDEDILIDAFANGDYPEQIIDLIKASIILYPPHNFSDFFTLRVSADGPDLNQLNS